MGKVSWLSEHYNTNAWDNTETWLGAAKHSLQKWRGTLPEVLEEHGIKYEERRLSTKGGPFLSFRASTCALCYKADLVSEGEDSCEVCPLTLSGNIGCNESGSAYVMNDPEEMVRVLEETVKWIEENNYGI